MKDTELTGTGSAIDIWTTPLYINKGDQISISIKGTFTGNIKIRRWLTAYGVDLPDDPVLSLRHIGVSNIFTEEIEAIDISGGTYYYQIGTDETFDGTAYVHLQ